MLEALEPTLKPAGKGLQLKAVPPPQDFGNTRAKKLSVIRRHKLQRQRRAIVPSDRSSDRGFAGVLDRPTSRA